MAEKQITLNLRFPGTGFRRRLHFNRFEIEVIEDLILLRFGLIREPHAPPLAAFACVIDKFDLAANGDRLLQYLPLIEHIAVVRPSPWVVQYDLGSLEVATIINLAQASGAAEILLGAHSMHSAVTAVRALGKSTPNLDVDPIALLRCSAPLQKAFVTKLVRLL
jgi:hypothetical protein